MQDWIAHSFDHPVVANLAVRQCLLEFSYAGVGNLGFVDSEGRTNTPAESVSSPTLAPGAVGSLRRLCHLLKAWSGQPR